MAPPSSGSPPPPEDFAKRELPVETIPAGTRLARIHRREFDPLHFGSKVDNRFSDPREIFGVCYMAMTKEGAFAETFVRGTEDEEYGSRMCSGGHSPESRGSRRFGYRLSMAPVWRELERPAR